MSETENKQPQPQVDPASIQVVRQSLTESIFKKYHELSKLLHTLPIQQGLPLVQKAHLEIDCSMLVFKEILATGALIFPKPSVPPKKEEVPQGTNQSQEPSEKQEKQPEGEQKPEENKEEQPAA